MIYVVKYGDTLSEIAKKYNTTTKALAEVNSIGNPDRILAGQRLTVPGIGIDWREVWRKLTTW